MNRLTRKAYGLAIWLAALAGFVDAVGFLQLKGLFVSFMSGNSTQFAVSLANGQTIAIGTLSAILLLFVGGTAAGTVLGHLVPTERRVTAVLALSAALLILASLGYLLHRHLAVIALMTMAMGAENAAFQRDGEVVVGLTYMTGTLVKFGQKLAAAFLGGERWGWVPHLGLWLGLVSGGVLGALSFAHLGLASLWIAATAASGSAGYAWVARIST